MDNVRFFLKRNSVRHLLRTIARKSKLLDSLNTFILLFGKSTSTSL
jgi:hypothetical protein